MNISDKTARIVTYATGIFILLVAFGVLWISTSKVGGLVVPIVVLAACAIGNLTASSVCRRHGWLFVQTLCFIIAMSNVVVVLLLLGAHT